MSKKHFIAIVFSLFFPLVPSAAPRYYAFLKGDTLHLGNERMERLLLWNGGAPITLALTDKLNGTTIRTEGKYPDFSIVKGNPKEAQLMVSEVSSNGISADFL